MNKIHPIVAKVTQNIVDRSAQSRSNYLDKISRATHEGSRRGLMSCTNQAHAYAAFSAQEKSRMVANQKPNIAIVSAYNDMLSAHQPFDRIHHQLKQAIFEHGCTSQFAGGVPAMCDGVTQGQTGMELSLFSRDVIAMATSVALSHNTFDGALYLGVCDKIVPGLLIGALTFGYLPAIFVPAGPMVSGMANDEKAKIRKLFAENKISREELLEAELKSYHSPGTCTFYGTANSNQLLMELLGLHLPGSSFQNPNTPLRDQLTEYAAQRITEITHLGQNFRPIGQIIDEKAIVNAMVGLLASGGSTNHTIHLVAIAKAAGILINWDDMAILSAIIPLLTRMYPNGKADVNHFQAAGGMSFMIRDLLEQGYIHGDITTIDSSNSLNGYTKEPYIDNNKLAWREGPLDSLDKEVLRSSKAPFSKSSGIMLLSGNLGRGIIKISAVDEAHRVVEAPAKVFYDQNDVLDAFTKNELNCDCVVVVKYQGPKANGMPELHKLTPALTILQDRGYKVALVTDGRMSGASGKVPSAIHVCPECLDDGPLAKIIDGDIIRLDAVKGVFERLVDDEIFASRVIKHPDLSHNQVGMGRELFSHFRALSSSAEQGASSILNLGH